MNVIFGIMGLVGGILCAVGDILFDLKGRNNKKSEHREILTVIG